MSRKVLTVMATLVFATAWFAATAAQPVRRYINPRSADDAKVPPFSGAVLVGDTLYLSGTIGRLPDGTVPDTAKEEATLVLNNIQGTLKSAGMTMDDLVWVQIFCSDVAHYDAFNDVYRGYFTREFPARSFLGSGRLLYGARFEVQGVAVRR